MENKSINEFDKELIHEYFSNLDRQGPGSPEVTVKALSFIDNLTYKSKIADVGCGTGGQTITLANNTQGHIIGIDISPKFINILNENAEKLNLQDRIKGITGSMDKLPLQDEELDLIWSEGAIFIIGFQHGLQEWRRFLKKGGYLAVTEASWLTIDRPVEINDFWNNAYPEIDTIPNKIKHLLEAGYIPAATFILPENCWTEHFYVPQVSAQEKFLKEYAGNKIAEEFIAYQKYEAELYRKYKNFYGYVFYIGKKI